MKRMLLVALAVTLFSCNKNDDNNLDDNAVVVTYPGTPGLAYSLSGSSFDVTYSALRSSLQSNDAISIVAEVDHGENASDLGLSLPNTRLIMFGNPALGTSLMQTNQLAGLDLPQKMLVYQNSSNNVFIAYNSTDYLAARYAIETAPTISQINSALSTIAINVTGNSTFENNSESIEENEGVITFVSQNDFQTTYNNLREGISNNTNLSIIAEVDHQANAQAVNMILNPTRLIVFSNPAAGTPLMQSSQITGIDLPQKMLVYEDENGVVKVSYTDPEFLAERHTIIGDDELLTTISSALLSLAAGAVN